MKYINQLDYPHMLYVTGIELTGERKERGKTTTVKTSGCGLCTAVMVADRLIPNCEFSLTDAIELSYEAKANCGLGTRYPRFAPLFAERLGLKLETSTDIEDVRRCLQTGGAAAILVDGDHEGYTGVFSHGPHYIAAIGVESDGRFAILDPSYKPGKYDEEGRQGKVERKYDVVALCHAEVLAEDAIGNLIPYFLFWRK